MLVNVEDDFRFRANPCWICGSRSGTGEIILPIFRASPLSTTPLTLHTHDFHS